MSPPGPAWSPPKVFALERRGQLRAALLGAIALVLAVQIGLGLLAGTGSAPTLWVLGGVLFVFFCGFNALEASQPSLVSRMAPASLRGAALGTYNTLQSLGLFAGGALGGALAKKVGGRIVTNDLNLNKVAELQGVRVLNINELCNALRPVVLPGETIRVFVLKEGKEAGQGVAYLDDGTMIVVDNARRCIGRNVDVTVTSVLQTTAGRMIFTRLKEDSEREEYQVARG